MNQPAGTAPGRLPGDALELFGDISRFMRTIAGNPHSAEPFGSIMVLSGVEVKVSGVLKEDGTRDAYLLSIGGGVILCWVFRKIPQRLVRFHM